MYHVVAGDAVILLQIGIIPGQAAAQPEPIDHRRQPARCVARLLQRRFGGKGGEIDLIMARGDDIAFVEVKTRTGDGYGGLAHAVTPRKVRRLRRLAGLWLAGQDRRRRIGRVGNQHGGGHGRATIRRIAGVEQDQPGVVDPAVRIAIAGGEAGAQRRARDMAAQNTAEQPGQTVTLPVGAGEGQGAAQVETATP